MPDMVASMQREIEMKSSRGASFQLETIYFGGGTPSVLQAGQLALLLETIRASFDVNPCAEITVEANPEDMETSRIEAWVKMGINRVSVGIQSFDDDRLKWMNRIHDGKTALDAIKNCRQCGIENLSGDLIFALPHAEGAFEKDLEQMMSLKLPHLSLYGLTIEEKTVFGNWLRKNKLKEVPDEVFERQFLMAEKALTHQGYLHYEISNYAQPGFESQHNTSYWLQKPYIGIGPGAHGYDGVSRSYNIPHNIRYIASLREGIIPETIETLNKTDQVNEYILTRIRTQYGVENHYLSSQFETDMFTDKSSEIASFLENGLIKVSENTLRLTSKGMLLCDEISLKLTYDK